MNKKGKTNNRPKNEVIEKKEEEDEEEEAFPMSAAIVEQNRKKKKSGGFQSMGLDSSVLRGVLAKGYRVPTPIQRRVIPLILQGQDVVAMARTGSGKTAAFLVPMFQKLVCSSSSNRGARSLILSPTRELALQTLKFCRELGKFTGLKACCVLGGDSMERQFAAMHENPDIVVATPGRFVHLCVEMGLKLQHVQYVVFDEADRLFEMGFGEQLREILARLPEARQTALFSATLPKLLVDFAKAGLTEPTLVRLDVDTKIPETLKLAFFLTRGGAETKPALLLHTLTNVIPQEQQVVVFAATRHHVEYLHALLDLAGIDNTFIYSQLDPTARKINAARFKAAKGAKKARVLIVTDLAARGIDVPLLDNVINYHFPAKSKLFVHRVGRVARAGRSGLAVTFVAQDELAYFVDLQLFLGGGKINIMQPVNLGKDWHNVLGSVPQNVPDDWADTIKKWMEDSQELESLDKVQANGFKQYLKSRPSAASESVKRAKLLLKGSRKIDTHPLLLQSKDDQDQDDALKVDFLEQMKKFRPHSTIFEIGNTSKNDKLRSVMSDKRQKHSRVIGNFYLKAKSIDESVERDEEQQQKIVDLPESSQEDIESAFSTVLHPKAPKNAKVFVKRKDKSKRLAKDEENYIGYQSKDHHTEAGYSMLSGFEAEASKAGFDLTGDDSSSMRKKRTLMRWDVKKKKYVKADQQDGQDKKKIKTESGVWIPASYKSDRYAKWREHSKLAQVQEAEEEMEQEPKGGKKRSYSGLPSGHPAMKKAKNAVPRHRKGPKHELKRPEQILKERKIQERKKGNNQKKKKNKKK